MEDSLRSLCSRGARMVRLDAYGYVTKKPGTRCFMEARSPPAGSGFRVLECPDFYTSDVIAILTRVKHVQSHIFL